MMMTFEKFQNRIAIKAKLVATTPIFIGARADSFKPGTINGSCLKDAYGRPYIPGSSLKGVLRAFLSSVLSEPADSAVNKAFRTKAERDKCGSTEKLAEKISKASTPVERLFGSQVMAGKVKIADAVLAEKRVTTEIRNGVAIDRDTHTANSRGGALFDTEVVPSGTVFNFNASAENLTEKEAELFGKLMEYFAEGNITVGGRSRAGLGNVELSGTTVTVYRAAENSFPQSEEITCEKSAIMSAVKSACLIKNGGDDACSQN